MNLLHGIESVSVAAHEAEATEGEILEAIVVVTSVCLQGLPTGVYAFPDD